MVFWKSFHVLLQLLVKNAKNNIFEDKCFLSKMFYETKMQAATNWSSHLRKHQTFEFFQTTDFLRNYQKSHFSSFLKIISMSQGIGIYTLVQPCCTSRLLWRRGRVSDCHPGDPGSIPVRVRSEDIFLHLSHLAPNVKSSYCPVQ